MPSVVNVRGPHSPRQEMLTRIDKGSAADPGGWDGDTNVSQLQLIVEQALELD